jgi:hypothetical protein
MSEKVYTEKENEKANCVISFLKKEVPKFFKTGFGIDFATLDEEVGKGKISAEQLALNNGAGK